MSSRYWKISVRGSACGKDVGTEEAEVSRRAHNNGCCSLPSPADPAKVASLTRQLNKQKKKLEELKGKDHSRQWMIGFMNSKTRFASRSNSDR